MTTENEARDYHGRWTASSVGKVVGPVGTDPKLQSVHPAGPFMAITNVANGERANTIAHQAAAVAKDLNFDPSLINISDESKTFELNGKTLPYAGAAHLPPPQGENTTPVKGTITLYTPHVTDEFVAGATAHEIAHQKFQAFMNESKDEYDRMQKDPDYHREDRWVPDTTPGGTSPHITRIGPNGEEPIRRELGFMRPDGLLNEPYASRYPVYQTFTAAMMPGTDKFAKTDGVSDYSREYWKAYAEGTANHRQAFHETLAEIARLKYGKQNVQHVVPKQINYGGEKVTIKKLRGLSPDWNKLYRAVEDNWKRRNK